MQTKKQKQKELSKTIKISSIQTSWIVSTNSRKFLFFLKYCENMNNNLNNDLLKNQNMTQRLIMKNE